MHFDQVQEGPYRIYAGAIEAVNGAPGYTAAVVVRRVVADPPGERDAWRDDLLACGHRWPSPQLALQYALKVGREVVRRRQAELAC